MSATIIGLANAVATILNDASYSQSFDAIVDLHPIAASEDVDELAVSVVAGPESWVKTDRGSNYIVSYDLIILVQGPVDTSTDMEDYALLVEEIKADVGKQKAAGLNVVEVIQDAPFNQERLYTENIFSTVITFRYRGFK